MKTVRIGNGAGFWGDSLDAPRRLADTGRLDYLTLEYLAELTLSILAHQKFRDPQAGHVTDFPIVLESLRPALRAQPDLKIVTNAGGMNPAACARRTAEVLTQAGLGDIRVATLSGDDLLPRLDDLRNEGIPFENLDTGRPLGELRSRVASANAYLGAEGIVTALSQGARIVITGRVADASLTVGPARYEFGWPADDWLRLAQATVAGHLIECGAQATGGMFSDWAETIRLADVGYPIAELTDDGSVVITKPTGSGGAVTIETVAEQLVYEIGDPAHYLTPDVDADFSEVRLTEDGADRVRVAGARGRPAPEQYKASLAYRDGYMTSGTLVIAGRDAARKARHCGEMILERVRRAGFELERTNIEILGAGDSVSGVWPRFEHAPEVVLRVSAHSQTRDAVERLAREFAPLVTSGPPGATGYTGPRAKPYPVLAYWPTTVPRSRITPEVTVQTAKEWLT